MTMKIVWPWSHLCFWGPVVNKAAVVCTKHLAMHRTWTSKEIIPPHRIYASPGDSPWPWWNFLIRYPVRRLSLKCWLLSYYLPIVRNSRSNNFPCQFPLLKLQGEEQSSEGWGVGAGRKKVCVHLSLVRVPGGEPRRVWSCTRQDPNRPKSLIQPQVSDCKVQLSWVMC